MHHVAEREITVTISPPKKDLYFITRVSPYDEYIARTEVNDVLSELAFQGALPVKTIVRVAFGDMGNDPDRIGINIEGKELDFKFVDKEN